MSPGTTRDGMTLDEALETLFVVIQGMQTVIDLASAKEAETAEEETAQQSVSLLRLFLAPLRQVHEALLEHQE